MSISATITTADQLLRAGDIGRCELIRGKLVMMGPAGAEHGRITARIVHALVQVVEEGSLGEVFVAGTGFLIEQAPDTVRAPDVAFVSAPRLAAMPAGKGFWPAAPDLAVEVRSPSDSTRDVRSKVHDWLRTGAREVWVVDPSDRSIAVHRAGEPPKIFGAGETLICPGLLPGFSMRVAALFG